LKLGNSVLFRVNCVTYCMKNKNYINFFLQKVYKLNKTIDVIGDISTT